MPSSSFAASFSAPHFLVIRNMGGLQTAASAPFCTDDIDGELIAMTTTYPQARLLIPQPVLGIDELLWQKAEQRFGRRAHQLSDGGMVEEPPELAFDDHPNHVDQCRRMKWCTDTEFFGQTYTILWQSVFEPAQLIAWLKRHMRQLLQELRHLRPIDGTICYDSWWRGYVKPEDELRHNYIDRLCVPERLHSAYLSCKFANALKELTEGI